MRYYSDKLDQLFDTEEDLFKAEEKAGADSKAQAETKEMVGRKIVETDARIDELEKEMMVCEKKINQAFYERQQLERKFNELNRRNKYTSKGCPIDDLDVFRLFN